VATALFLHEHGSTRKHRMVRDAQHCGEVDGVVYSRGVSARTLYGARDIAAGERLLSRDVHSSK